MYSFVTFKIRFEINFSLSMMLLNLWYLQKYIRKWPLHLERALIWNSIWKTIIWYYKDYQNIRCKLRSRSTSLPIRHNDIGLDRKERYGGAKTLRRLAFCFRVFIYFYKSEISTCVLHVSILIIYHVRFNYNHVH